MRLCSFSSRSAGVSDDSIAFEAVPVPRLQRSRPIAGQAESTTEDAVTQFGLDPRIGDVDELETPVDAGAEAEELFEEPEVGDTVLPVPDGFETETTDAEDGKSEPTALCCFLRAAGFETALVVVNVCDTTVESDEIAVKGVDMVVRELDAILFGSGLERFRDLVGTMLVLVSSASRCLSTPGSPSWLGETSTAGAVKGGRGQTGTESDWRKRLERSVSAVIALQRTSFGGSW